VAWAKGESQESPLPSPSVKNKVAGEQRVNSKKGRSEKEEKKKRRNGLIIGRPFYGKKRRGF